MAVRFRNEHTSWAVSSPITWKIEIFDADHVGGVTDFEVASGASLNYRGDGDDALAPILSSTVTFSMMVEDATHEQLITDLAGAAEGRFTIVLYKDSVFNWAGVINSPEINIEDADYPFSFEITAVDGLALLKNYEYKQNITSGNKWTEVYDAQSEITTIMARCLKKLPHVVTHFTGSAKFLVTAINWYSNLHVSPATPTYDPFFYTQIDNRVFADGQSGGAAKFLSCYNVLSILLKTFQARISLFDGYFLVEQFEHRYATIGAPANYSRYYNYALTAPAANTLTADQDIGGSNSIQKLRGGSYSFLPALKNVRVKQRLNALQNLIPTFNVSSDNPSAGYAVGWVKGDGLNTYVRFTGTIEFSITPHSGYPIGSTYATFNLKIELDSLFAKRNVTYNSNGTYNLAVADWDAAVSYVQIPVKVEAGATGEAWEGQTYKIDIIFRTDSTFSFGDMVVDFDLLNIQYFNLLSSGVVDPSYYTFKWTLRDAYCTIQEARTAFAPKSVTYQVDGGADNSQQLLVETLIGDKDGDIINQWGGLLFFNNPGYNYTATWGNRDGTRDRPLTQLLGQRLMQMFYFPRKVLRGTAVGGSLVVQVPVTENSTETYFLKNGSYSTHRDELNGEWVRLVFSGESLTYQAAEYETGEYQATQAGNGGGNVDTGGGATGTTSTVVFPNVAQGDLLYGTDTNTISALGKDTNATRYLSNTGTSNNPAWAQINLTNGVTGSLPFANIGTIATQKLLGRYSAGTGVIEQITISTGLALDGSGNLTASGLGGTVTSVNVSGGTTGMTFSGGAITTSGTITMSGTLDADNGGTGQSVYTVGDILYASAATTLTKLNSGPTGTFLRSAGAASPVAWSAVTFPNSAITGDVLYASAANTYSALAGVATGNALISGGVSTAPSWGKIGLTTHVSGTLGATNGGTGQSTVAQGDLLYGSAADVWSKLAKNTSATRYLSNTGTSNNPAWAQIDLTNGVTGILPVANGGTGIATLSANRIPYGNGTSAFQSSANLTYDGSRFAAGLSSSVTAGVDLNGYTTSTLGSPVLTADFMQMRFFGTPTTVTNNIDYRSIYLGAALSNDGTPTGGSTTGITVETSVASPTKLSNYSGSNFIISSTSSNVDVMYGTKVTVTDWTTGASLDNRTGLNFDVFKRGDAVDIHVGRGIQGRVIDLTATGRWLSGVGADLQVQQALTGRALLVSVTNSRGTGNTQYGTDITLTTSGSGVTSTTVYGHNITISAASSGTITTAYAFRNVSSASGITTAYNLYNSTDWRNYLNGSLAIGVDVTTAKLFVRGAGATSATVTAVFENSSGTDILYVRDDGKVSIGNSSPQQTFHVTGTMRLTGSDGTATGIMGRDGDGDISEVALSADLAITSGTLGLVDTTVITPSQITSNQNNFNPTGLSTAGTMLIFADNGFRQITGITAPSTAKKLTVVNIGSYSILFPRESTSSSAANRIRMSRDFVLLPGKTVTFVYDTAATKWRILSVGDSYADSAHLWLDTQITAPVTAVNDHHWQYSSGGSDWVIAPTAGRWSGHDLDTGTTTSGIGSLNTYSPLFESSTTAAHGVWGYFKAHIKTPSAVSDGTNTYLVKAGFVDAVSGGAVNGIYFSYDVGTSASIYAITRASATSTSTNTGTAFGADTVHLLELVYRPNGTTEFWLNGVTVATHSTNVPLTDLYSQIIIQKTAGTTERRLTWYAAQTTLARVS